MAVKNLIIKSSYSKLPDGSLKSNLGDLIRCTVLMECLKNDALWLTDSRSLSLLKWFVDRTKIITYDDISNYATGKETRIFNMDNYLPDKEIFGQLDGKWHGFIRKGMNDVIADNDLIRCTEPYTDIDCEVSWQEALVRGMGFKWERQDYSSDKLKKNDPVYDVGLNWNVHHEWESKRWPHENWKLLEDTLSTDYSVSWQRGLNDFDEYIDWISSCRLIVTCDTLGLHLASALGKKVVAVTGVTDCREYPYGRVTHVKPEIRDCMPCNKPVCKYGRSCLESISADRVNIIIRGILRELNKTEHHVCESSAL